MVFHWTPSEDAWMEYGIRSLLPRTTLISPSATGLANLTVSIARGSAATQAVAGLPSTAATAGDPGSDEVAVIWAQRARSSVGSRSERRVGIVSAAPGRTVFAPLGVMTGRGAPELRVTIVSCGPMCT